MPTITATRTTANYDIPDQDLILTHVDRPYVFRFKDLPDAEKPRERLQQFGPGNLSTAELVAVIWGVGTRSEDVLAMATRTLRDYGERAIGNELDSERLAAALDIPHNKASQLIAAFELGRRFYATQAGRPVQVRNAKQAYQYLKDMGHGQKEQLRGLYLNSRYQVVYDEIISIGSMTSNIVHPREVFRPALERGATAVIVAHNHPSGHIEPTRADIEVTKQLIEAGEVLGIELLDHLVIANKHYASVLDVIGPN